MMEDVPMETPRSSLIDLEKINPYFQYFPVSEQRDLKKETRFKSPSMSPGYTTALAHPS
jgi:hypothetical protein